VVSCCSLKRCYCAMEEKGNWWWLCCARGREKKKKKGVVGARNQYVWSLGGGKKGGTIGWNLSIKGEGGIDDIEGVALSMVKGGGVVSSITC